MNNIKMYKLLSGLEIIGKVAEEGIGWVTLDDAHGFHIVQTGPSDYGLDLRPLSPVLPDHRWKLYTSNLLGEPVGEIPDALVRAYLEKTSKIQIASSI